MCIKSDSIWRYVTIGQEIVSSMGKIVKLAVGGACRYNKSCSEGGERAWCILPANTCIFWMLRAVHRQRMGDYLRRAPTHAGELWRPWGCLRVFLWLPGPHESPCILLALFVYERKWGAFWKRCIHLINISCPGHPPPRLGPSAFRNNPGAGPRDKTCPLTCLLRVCRLSKLWLYSQVTWFFSPAGVQGPAIALLGMQKTLRVYQIK